MKLYAVFLLCAFATTVVYVVAQSPPSDPCGQWMDCNDCVSHDLCGWCSLPVIFPGNITGPQCAGFSPNGSTPFACNGIYSTDTCIQGYVCNLYNFTCDLAPPGQGVPKLKCESDCYNKGQVFLCNKSTNSCYVVPPGTPGSSNYQVCMQQCANIPPAPTSSPSPMSPQPTPTPNPSPTPSPTPQVQKYVCNQFLWQCLPSPVGNDIQTCQDQCGAPKPNPGPPPAFLGTWRGVFIQNGYAITEFAMEVTQSTFRSYISATNQSYNGIPLNYQTNGEFQLWVNFTTNDLAGKVIKAIGSQTSDSPETRGMTVAWGAPNGAAPSSILEAMAGNNGELVTYLSKCITPMCVFTLPTSLLKAFDASKLPRKGLSLARRQILSSEKGPSMTDHCSQFNANCSQCLSNLYCGWCSENVTYNDGTPGTQCAGFNPNSNSSAFVCEGRYSTIDCTPGYKCDTNTYQCEETDPGNGFPHDVCLQVCHPTPAPSQTPQFVCNLTTQQCLPCNQTMCPGSMPQGECDESCAHAKPGPQSSTQAFWRGVQIRNDYTYGEYELLLTNVSATMYFQNKMMWNATVISLGANVMVLRFTEGQGYQGRSQSALFQLGTNDALVQWMDIAFGPLDGNVPAGFDQAMSKPYDQYLLVSCLPGTPCNFKPPTP